jgi:hypothetical protein
MRAALGLTAATLVFGAACSSGDAPKSGEARDAAVGARTGAVAPTIAAPIGRSAASKAAAAARRCGWLHNPTPANWWLVDADGEWVLSTQGGAQVPGFEDMPDMSTRGWQEVNGHYGYGCACLTLTADPATRKVTRLAAAEPKPLGQCRSDRTLPALEPPVPAAPFR